MSIEVQSYALESQMGRPLAEKPPLELPLGPPSSSLNKDDSTASVTETSFGSIRSTTLLIQDTSIDGAVETSRITVNTHNSILNITEEDDDDELFEHGVETSFLFADEVSEVKYDEKSDHASSCIPQTPCRPSWCESEETGVVPPGSTCELTVKDSSIFDSVTDGFMDTLCFTAGGKGPLKTERDVVAWEQYQRVLEYDIEELLGCSSPPDQDELSKVWQFNLVHTPCDPPNTTGSDSAKNTRGLRQRRARRRNWRERALRVHRLRMQRNTASATSAPPGRPIPLSNKSRSMDDRLLWNAENSHSKKNSWAAFHLFSTSATAASSDEPDLGHRIGEGLEPILPDAEDDGYDSDPEERAAVLDAAPKKPAVAMVDCNPKPSGKSSLFPPPPPPPSSSSDSPNIVDTVQETLNMSWTLTWHPSTMDAFREPRTVQAWIERGTLVESNTVMLEPNVMWRETFQPQLETKKKLNASSQKPFNVRLLNLCRILADGGIDRSIYPLVRPSCCFLIRTSDGKEHLFEAKSTNERDDLVRRWKLTTARFATLAVLEDLETICREFFSPMITSRMLVPDYGKMDGAEELDQSIEDTIEIQVK